MSDEDFLPVSRALTATLGGDANPAYLLALILHHTRRDSRAWHMSGDRRWWPAAITEISDDTGMSVHRVRRALAILIDEGYVLSEKHRLDGPHDQRLSYCAVESKLSALSGRRESE